MNVLYGIDKSDHTDNMQRNSMFTEFIPRLLRYSKECVQKNVFHTILNKNINQSQKFE